LSCMAGMVLPVGVLCTGIERTGRAGNERY